MKTLGRLLAVVMVLGLLGALLFYKRPLWVELQLTHTKLLLARVQSNYVMTPEGRIHYYEAESEVPGGGTPLVLIHGLADRGEAWQPMLGPLKKAGFHVYAPDLLGYGRSPHPADSDYSISTQEQLVADFVHALGLQRADVGGWSMGGWVAMKLALDHPEMVDRLIVYDTAGLKFQIAGGPEVFHPTTQAQLQRLASLLEPNAPQIPRFALRDALREFEKNQWVVDRSMASMESGKDLLDDRISSLTEPMLIVWGADDHLLPLDIARQLHRLVPQSELDVVNGCGHLAPKTCSAPVIWATEQFLEANPAPMGGERTLSK
jgi:pimeloyl-ACP methyl ester carboxylesterase